MTYTRFAAIATSLFIAACGGEDYTQLEDMTETETSEASLRLRGFTRECTAGITFDVMGEGQMSWQVIGSGHGDSRRRARKAATSTIMGCFEDWISPAYHNQIPSDCRHVEGLNGLTFNQMAYALGGQHGDWVSIDLDDPSGPGSGCGGVGRAERDETIQMTVLP